MNWDCRRYLQLCKENLFPPHSVLLKLWSMIMWIFVEGRLWQLNKSLALWTTILSAPSKGGKTFFSFFTLSQSVSSIYLCHKKISPLPHSLCHTASVHEKLEAPSWGHQQGHRAGEDKKTHLLPHVAQLRAIGVAEILIPLSKHIWGFPASVVWLTAIVSEGLALCTPNVKPQPDECLSGQGWRSELWVMWEDRKGWEETAWGNVLPQESQNLFWPVGFSCLQRRAFAATISVFSVMAPTDTELAKAVSGAWWHCMLDPCHVIWKHSSSLAEEREHRR